MIIFLPSAVEHGSVFIHPSLQDFSRIVIAEEGTFSINCCLPGKMLVSGIMEMGK